MKANAAVMRWHRIEVRLPFLLLESTYNFLWPFINGISVDKWDGDFLLKAYLCSAAPGDLIKRLNNFLRIRSRSFQTRYFPPSARSTPPLQTGGFIVVPAPTAHVPPFGTPIFIQRGRAFGIGSHPCTIYCMQAVRDIFEVEPEVISSGKLFDAGTGTGILSIAAAKLGAKDITAVEISLEAVNEARENIDLNCSMGEIHLLHSSVTDINEQYDLILANLYGPLLIEIVSSLVELLSPRGWLILGGMAVPHDEKVITTFAQRGLKECKRYRDDEWAVAILRKL